MSLNHHILAKTTTDAILLKFKTVTWSYADGMGQDFYRVGTSADFPSPDASFFDPTNKVIAAFEFKPPTETKRGILTGIGQSIAYLQQSDISFLVAPVRLQDFDLRGYLTNLYEKQIVGKIPTGLILYDNNNPTNIQLAHNIKSLFNNAGRNNIPKMDRFWAKHQDLPIPLFHLILHYYYLDKTAKLDVDPFALCFTKEFISENVLDNFEPKPYILDLSGLPIRTVAGTKNIVHLEKILVQAKKSPNKNKARAIVQHAIDTNFVGDNLYNSYRKNYLSFMKQMQVLDSNYKLTDKGFLLYHLGLVNGPTSKIFVDYFIKELLTTGHHLDLILDIDTLKQQHSEWNIKTILSCMEVEYEDKGYIKRNPNRKNNETSNVSFLKYERILWNSLNIVDNNGIIQWKKISEIFSLPELK